MAIQLAFDKGKAEPSACKRVMAVLVVEPAAHNTTSALFKSRPARLPLCSFAVQLSSTSASERAMTKLRKPQKLSHAGGRPLTVPPKAMSFQHEFHLPIDIAFKKADFENV